MLRFGSTFALLAVLLVSPGSGVGYAWDKENPELLPQDLRFEHLTTEDGLSEGRVWGMTQDDKGFMWFATFDGINRYDGYDFKVYKQDYDNPNSPSGSTFWTVYADREGMIWAGSINGGGLSRLDPVTEQWKRYLHDPNDPHSLGGNNVYSIVEDRTGVIWVGTESGGLNRFDGETQDGVAQFTHYQHNPDDPHSLAVDFVDSIYEDRSGVLWVGTYGGGLHRFNRETESFMRYQADPNDPGSLSSNLVYSIFEDRFGVLWVGTYDNGLNRFDPQTETFTHYKSNPKDPGSISGNTITSIREDLSGTLWIGTFDGGLNVYHLELDNFSSYQHDPFDSRSIGSSSVTSLLLDFSGTLWIGSGGRGVSKLDPRAQGFALYQRKTPGPNSLSYNDVRAIYEDRFGDIWIGTWGGLNRLDPRTGRFTQYLHDEADTGSLNDNHVFAIEEDHLGTLWVGVGTHGLNRFDHQTGTFTHFEPDSSNPDSLSDGIVTRLYADRSGVLWIGTWAGGLNALDLKSIQAGQVRFTHFQHDRDDPHSLGEGIIYSIIEDQAGELWVGTGNGGLCRLDRAMGTFNCYEHDPAADNSLSDNTVWVIHQDLEGVLWLGTNTGLNRFDPQTGKFVHFTEVDGLPSDVIYGILEDREGRFWLSTGHGLSLFNPQERTFRNYQKADGLQGNNFNFGAYYQSSQGEMFFGGPDGLTAFFPADILVNSYVPPIYVTDIQLSNVTAPIGGESPLQKSIIDTQDLILSHDARVISFTFTALSYTSPRGNRYRYKLEGFDDHWTEVGSDQRRITYTNLDPGEYTLRVIGSNNDGLWNEAGASVHLTILPPWWQTWWFRGATLLLLLGLVVGGFVWQRQNARRRERYLEAQIVERTQDLAFAEEQIQTLFKSSQVGIGLTNQEGRILAFNEALLNITGYTETDAINQNVIYFYADPEQRDQLLDQLSTAKAVHDFGVKLKRKDGNLIFANMNVSKIRRAGQEVFLTLIEDVTEHIQLTEQLQEEIIMRKQTEKALHRVYNQQSALLEITQELRVTEDLAALLDRAMENLRYLVDADWTGVMLLDEDGMLNTQGFFSNDGFRQLTKVQISVREMPSLEPILVRHEVIYIPDLSTHSGILDEFNPQLDEQWKALLYEVRTWLGIPLVAQNRIIGLLNLLDTQPNQYDEKTRNLIQTFANHLAVAIMNAQHYAQAQDIATFEERNRLARELHDSVTQSLYTTSLIAEALPVVWERQPEEAHRSLDELRQLTQGTLAEMRTLLMELRPDALVNRPLSDLLQQLVDGITARTNLPITTTITEERSVPARVQVAFYRITQEALNNIVKHSQAKHAWVSLRFHSSGATLRIKDDGIGFNIDKIKSNQFGLSIMCERTEGIGAESTINSQPGQGTEILVDWLEKSNRDE